MKIPSKEIPQADSIVDVVNTVIAVSRGAHSFQEIARFINKVERQGRYYRRAAEILGLIITPKSNYSVLTSLGSLFIQTGTNLNNPVLLQSVINTRIFQRIIPYLERNANGVKRESILNFLSAVADFGEAASMPHRRISTIISWMEELGIVQRTNDWIKLNLALVQSTTPILNFDNTDEPLLPAVLDLNEYETVAKRVKRAHNSVLIYKDLAKLDRANQAHKHLVDLVADRIRGVGGIPKSNQLIDLATRHESYDFIFEMKSITPENTRDQIRNGISQLFEYRYLQNLPNSNLVLVVESPLKKDLEWMQEYLESDMNVSLVWDGNNKLYSSRQTKQKLNFLGLIA